MGRWEALEPHVVKNVKEYNASRPKHMQFITPQQMKHYDDEVSKSEGFVVRNCPGFMVGKIVPIVEYSREWELAEIAAKFAAIHYERQLDHPPLKSVTLIRANIQSVGGMMYYLTFKGTNGSFVEAIYQSKIWLKPAPALEGVFFRKVPESEKYVGKIRRRSNSQSGNSGYYAYVRSLREKNHAMTFAKAKREASRLWKDLPKSEKNRFVRAAKREQKKRVSN